MEEKRSYQGDGITVSFEAKICAHAAECVKGLPSVFNVDNRPWINPDGATPEEVVDVIGRCPSGALTYTLPEADGMEVTPSAGATVQVMNNGPLVIAGGVTVTDADGNVVREADRVALCRCGGSEKKPFCDGAHNSNGFEHQL